MSQKKTFTRRRLSTRQGTQGQSQGGPSPTPLNPHPIQVPPAAQVGGKSTYRELESRRGHWSKSTGGFRWRSPPDGRRVIRRFWRGRPTEQHGRRGGKGKNKERKRANCRGQGTRKNLVGAEKGRGGNQNHHRTGKSSKLNLRDRA